MAGTKPGHDEIAKQAVRCDFREQLPLLICPTGNFPICLSSPHCKNIPLRRRPKSLHIHNCLVPLEGRIRIVRDAGRDAVGAAASIFEQL